MREEEPKILYKYRPLFSYWQESIDEKTGNKIKIKSGQPILNNNTISLLTKGELYFSNPIDFNDPYDSWMPFLPPPVTEQEIMEKLKSKTEKGVGRELRKLIRLYFNGDISAYVNAYNRNVLPRLNQAETFLDINKYLLGSKYIVACFSKVYNNILMWSHYASNHTGVCVGIKLSKGKIGFNTAEDEIESFKPRKVEYSLDNKKLPLIKADSVAQSLFSNALSFKSKDWKYEEEYRLMLLNNKKNNITNVLQLTKNLICEIIFGLKTPDDVITKTLNEIKNSDFLDFDKVEFYVMKDKFGFYEVEPKEINPYNYL